jgi:hypothetical protein
MKTLDDLIVGRNALWFTLEEASKAFRHSDFLFMYDSGGSTTEPCEVGVRLLDAVISKEQFQQRAKELGFVGKYRWGIEYATNGKRPDLADDVEIKWQAVGVREWWPKYDNTTVGELDWNGKYAVYSFKITDQRYKPADTGYLDKPERCGLEAPENLNHKCSSSDVRFGNDNAADWYCYETQKALRLPPVGTECLVWFDDGKECWQKCKVLAMSPYEHDHMAVSLVGKYDRKLIWSQDFMPLDHATRKAEAEKKRVVDAAIDAMKPNPLTGTMEKWFGKLYDAGYLRLPTNKD